MAPASALTVGTFNCGSPQFRNGRCNRKFNFSLHPQEGPKGDSHPVCGAVINVRWVSLVESPFDSISVQSIAQCSLSHGHRSLDSGCDDHSKFRCFWLFSGGVSGLFLCNWTTDLPETSFPTPAGVDSAALALLSLCQTSLAVKTVDAGAFGFQIRLSFYFELRRK